MATMLEAQKRYEAALADGTFSLGSCKRCGEPFTATPTGRIADHLCPDVRAAAAGAPRGPQPITELERPVRTESWYEKEYDLDE